MVYQVRVWGVGWSVLHRVKAAREELAVEMQSTRVPWLHTSRARCGGKGL